jgi:hypothetical protein
VLPPVRGLLKAAGRGGCAEGRRRELTSCPRTCPSPGGKSTQASTCEAYGYTAADTCTHAASGGGGGQCGHSFVCCVVSAPKTIPPDVYGLCHRQIA